MHVNKVDQIDERSSGKPLPPWTDAAEDQIVGVDAELPEPAVIEKTLSTLASELRNLLFRDRQSRLRRDR